MLFEFFTNLFKALKRNEDHTCVKVTDPSGKVSFHYCEGVQMWRLLSPGADAVGLFSDRPDGFSEAHAQAIRAAAEASDVEAIESLNTLLGIIEESYGQEEAVISNVSPGEHSPEAWKNNGSQN